MSRQFSEEFREATADERGLARDTARIAQRAADYVNAVASGKARVSDLLVEKMWDFVGFPLLSAHEFTEATSEPLVATGGSPVPPKKEARAMAPVNRAGSEVEW